MRLIGEKRNKQMNVEHNSKNFKKMKTLVKTTIFLAVCMLGVATANAQNLGMKHEIRPFYGTAYAASDSDIFANTLSNGLLGISEKNETTTFGMVGLGYRYHINKFGLGLDLGYSTAKEELYKKAKDTKPFETSNIKRYFAMPTISYSYYKRNAIELYGAASAGAIYQTTKKDVKDAKTKNETLFAYQVTPIGLRIGSETIGAFVELGYGQKGIVNAGLSFKF